ncbi:MAG: hypothetical protein M1834_005434 [Cirrosporium novae-zelandiae]|nr:MAG: hypothetical protein M1834_005434 [Cirrosporium novae-zelandiae]
MEISRIAELLRNLPYDVSYMILQYLTPTDLAMWSYVHANLKAIIDAFCNRGRMKRFITSVGPSWATIRHHIVADESSKTGDRTTNLWIVFSNGQTIQQLFPDLRQYNPERNRELSLCKLAQPIIFFTRWIQSYQYLCGFRLSDGSILGVKSESPHYTQVTLGREDQISLCIDGREQSIIDEANYVTTKSHLEGELSLLAVEMIPLPKKAGRITFFFRNSTSFIQGIEVYSDSIRQLTGSKDGYAINFSYSDQESIQRIEVRVPNNTIMRSLDLKFYTDRRQFSFAPLSTDGYKTRVLQPKANESLTGFILRRAKCQGHVVSFGIVCEEKERTDQNSNKNRRYTLLKNTSQTYQDRTSIMTGDILQGIKHCTFQHFAKLTQVERIGWFLDEKNRCRGLQLYYRDGSVEETLGRWQQNQPVIKWLKDDEEIIAILIKHSTRSQYTVEEISFETTLGRRLGPDQSDQYQLHYPVGENSVSIFIIFPIY